MSERITISVIESKEFEMKPRGYDRDQVDAFLDEICDEMERMNNEILSLRQQLREAQANAVRPVQAPAAPAPAPVPAPAAAPEEKSSELVSMLELAARLRDETIAEAKKQAEKIVGEAENKAVEQLASLSDERDSLTQQVEALRKSAADYRTRFGELLQAQREALDKISDL